MSRESILLALGGLLPALEAMSDEELHARATRLLREGQASRRKVVRLGLARESGWRYFVEGNGGLYCAVFRQRSRDELECLQIVELDPEKDRYFVVDDDGDIASEALRPIEERSVVLGILSRRPTPR